MRTIGMKHGCRLRDRLVAAIFALAVPSIAFADGNNICLQVLGAAPSGGSIQLKVAPRVPNDPTPIIIDLMSICLGGDTGAVKGVTLPESPDAAGSAVNDGSSLVIRTVSPAPTIAVTIAVPDQAPVETTDGGTADPGASSTVSVTDVLPGGGFLPAGSLVAVMGVGFQPEAQVLIDDVAVASTSWVDSSRIEFVTAVEAQLDGKRITVINPDGTGATYLSYLRATDLGLSARPLLAATEAIFPVQTQSSTVFAAPADGTFFGLALQNPQPADSIVSVELWDAGAVVASASLALPSRTKVSREVSELFPGIVPSAESFLQVTATVPVQMLGLSGNEVDGSVTPVLPAFASP
jgi:hypothetical protein